MQTQLEGKEKGEEKHLERKPSSKAHVHLETETFPSFIRKKKEEKVSKKD